MRSSISNIIISIVFVLMLYSVFINQSFKIHVESVLNENRKLAEKPKLDISKLDFFPKKYDNYYQDNFSFRANFLHLMRFLELDIFNKNNDLENVLIGDDNCMFDLRKDLSVFMGDKLLTSNQLNKLLFEFEQREKYFNSKGAQMYILICPSKYSVYSEKLPWYLKSFSKNRTEQFINFVNEKSKLNIIDGRKSLLKRKSNHALFLKNDNHWNNIGAFFAGLDLIETLRKEFPNVPKYNLSDFEIDTCSISGGNLSTFAKENDVNFKFKLKGEDIIPLSENSYQKEADFPYDQNNYCQRYCSSLSTKKLPKVFIIRDSFANYTTMFLPYYFKETLYIWDRWEYKMNRTIFDAEKPDIVLFMIYEGFIHQVLLEPTFVDAEIIE